MILYLAMLSKWDNCARAFHFGTMISTMNVDAAMNIYSWTIKPSRKEINLLV